MAAVEVFAAPRHIATGIDTLTAEDFETASIRSAAPSYVSEAPSYHSNPPETLPPYTPSTTDLPRTANTATTSTTGRSTATNNARRPSANPRTQTQRQRGGLPPVPTTPLPLPSLNAFAIPSWSTFSANPTTRHYHSVAQRRVAAANSRVGSSQLRNYLLDSVAEEDGPDGRGGGMRYLEDPYVVGEEAAREARDERLRRERDEQLRVENRRWDWYISQMNAWQEQERTWTRFRKQTDNDERKSFMRRVSGRLF